jgi:hypothetical protein
MTSLFINEWSTGDSNVCRFPSLPTIYYDLIARVCFVGRHLIHITGSTRAICLAVGTLFVKPFTRPRNPHVKTQINVTMRFSMQMVVHPLVSLSQMSFPSTFLMGSNLTVVYPLGWSLHLIILLIFTTY